MKDKGDVKGLRRTLKTLDVKMRGKSDHKVFYFFIFVLIIWLCLGLTCSANAKELQMEWNYTFGGIKADRAFSVQQTSDGGYILVGETKSFAAGESIYLVKTDKNGKEEWSRTFDGTWGTTVRQSSDGGYIIVGLTHSFGAGRGDVYLIKTDKNGNKEWSKTFGGKRKDEGISVEQTSDGGYILVGYTESFGEGDRDVYLIKVDNNGNEEWSKTFGGPYANSDMGYSVKQTLDGGYIIVGLTKSFGAGLDSCVYLIKTDENGNEEWSRTFGGSGDDAGFCVLQTSDGGYIICGYTESFGAGEKDIYLIKTNEIGEEIWSKTFGGSKTDRAYQLLQTTEGGYIIVGLTNSFGNGLNDVYLLKTDKNGKKIWDKTFGGLDADFGYSICQTFDGGYVIVGATESFGTGQRDVWLIKLISAGLNKTLDKTFGGPRNDVGQFVQQTSDDGYIIVGYTESSGAGGKDIYLIKTDRNGNGIWDKTFGGAGNESGLFVSETRDGGYIITGWTDSFGAGNEDVYLLKVSKDGKEEWHKTFGGSGADCGVSVHQTSDGGYIVIGKYGALGIGETFGGDIYLIKTDKNGNVEWSKTFEEFSYIRPHPFPLGVDVGSGCITSDEGYIIVGGKKSSIYLFKTDKNGEAVWNRTYEEYGTYRRGKCVQQTSDNGYIVVGHTREAVYGKMGDTNIYLFKTDENGNGEWSKTFGGTESEWSEAVQQTPDGGYIIAGYTESSGAGGKDIFVIKTDEKGNEEWSKTLGGAEDDIASSLQLTSDGGYIIAGYTKSFGAGDKDVWLIKLGGKLAPQKEEEEIKVITPISTPTAPAKTPLIPISLPSTPLSPLPLPPLLIIISVIAITSAAFLYKPLTLRYYEKKMKKYEEEGYDVTKLKEALKK